MSERSLGERPLGSSSLSLARWRGLDRARLGRDVAGGRSGRFRRSRRLAPPLLATAFRYFPDFFFNTLTLRGVPLVFFKDDLLATLFAAAFFWLWTRWEFHHHRRWLLPVGACLLMVGTTTSPRAAMVAVAGVTGLWLAARRWQIAATQAVVIGVAAIGALFVFSLTNRDLRQTAAYAT